MKKHDPLAFLDKAGEPKKSSVQLKADKYFAEQEKRLGKLPKPRKPRKRKSPRQVTP